METLSPGFDEVGDLLRKSGASLLGTAYEHDARRRSQLGGHRELAEILVFRQQDALFPPGA